MTANREPLTITSLQNRHVKQVLKLSKRRARDEHGQTVVEGARECARALACQLTPVASFVAPPLLEDTPLVHATVARLQALHDQGVSPLFLVTPDVYAKIAYRGESGGILMTIAYPRRTLESLPTTASFVALIEGVEKPGNLGAILRTADAAGVNAVLVCSDGNQTATDVHNPNVIRASLGTVFNVPVVETDTRRALAWLRAQGSRLIAATPGGDKPYTTIAMTGPVAVALGSEAHGLSATLTDAADERVYIPMHGIADSLNLATSAALMLYEVVRQRAGVS